MKLRHIVKNEGLVERKTLYSITFVTHFIKSMKRIYFLAFLICALTVQSFAQTAPPPPPVAATPPADTATPPYKKYPDMPAFNSLSLDSVVFNTYSIKKGKYSILILFSPTCEHCQKMTEGLVRGMDSLKKINFYMFAFSYPLGQIAEFRHKYGLDQFKNVWMGKDAEYFMPSFYICKDVPFIVLYDKNKKFVRTFDRGFKVSDIVAAVDEDSK